PTPPYGRLPPQFSDLRGPRHAGFVAPRRIRRPRSVRSDQCEESLHCRDSGHVSRHGGRPREVNLKYVPAVCAAPPEETDGSPPCTPQRKERLDPTVSQGEPGVGRDGEGRDRGDNCPSLSRGSLDGFDWRAVEGRLRRPERSSRDGSERDADPIFEGDEIHAAGGSRQFDQTRGEPSNPSQGSPEG